MLKAAIIRWVRMAGALPFLFMALKTLNRVRWPASSVRQESS